MDSERIRLTEEKETLFVPLLGKAMMSKEERPIIVDPKAEEIIASVDYDFAELETPRKTLVTLAMRAKKLDSYVRAYLAETPDPLVLHLGCGLDSRVLRVGFDELDAGSWYDLDYPEVVELRRRFYEETDRYRMIGSSVTDLTWLEQVPPSPDACIVAEGLLMYLHDAEVRQLFEALQVRFPGSEICFDAFSRLTARSINRHPSIKKTGAHIHWGIDDPSEIEGWGSGMKVLDEWAFTDSEDIASLSLGYRMMFRASALSSAARKAQRILRVRL